MSQEVTSVVAAPPGRDIEVGDSSRLPGSPLLSVCMVTYNHAPYIREALDSILMQQVGFPYEICLGEDDSTDGTREICLEYTKRHPDKIRLFLRDRGNPARKKYRVPFMYNGVETGAACRGKYVALLEGDDYWISRNKLGLQVAALEANPACSVVAHYVARMPEGRPWGTYVIPGSPMREFTLESLLRDRFYIHTSSLMFRRGPDIKRDIFTDAVCGDVPLLFCYLLRGMGIMLPQVMSVYRVTNTGVFTSQSAVVQAERAVALWETLKPFVPVQLRELHQKGYIRILADATAEYRRNRLAKAASRSSQRALSMIAALKGCSFSGRISLLADVMEGLLSPRLRKVRRRLTARLRSRRFEAVPATPPRGPT